MFPQQVWLKKFKLSCIFKVCLMHKISQDVTKCLLAQNSCYYHISYSRDEVASSTQFPGLMAAQCPTTSDLTCPFCNQEDSNSRATAHGHPSTIEKHSSGRCRQVTKASPRYHPVTTRLVYSTLLLFTVFSLLQVPHGLVLTDLTGRQE